MQNVEYKAELRDLPLARSVARSIGARFAETVEQTDTYYRLASGRLKRRETRRPADKAAGAAGAAGAGGAGVAGGERGGDGDAPGGEAEVEYIFYERRDLTRVRLSTFTIYSEAQALQRFGAAPLPVRVVVKKTREVYLHGPGLVRIHLDTVEGLGAFLEFEAPVSEGHDLPAGHRAVALLKEAFGPTLGEPIAVSYSDLLAADAEEGG